MMAMSDFRPKVEIWPFCACAMKNMLYNHYYRNNSVIVDLNMGQIPRFTERLSSFFMYLSGDVLLCLFSFISTSGINCVEILSKMPFYYY